MSLVLRPEGRPIFNPALNTFGAWPHRLIHATAGNKTFLGMVVLAVLGKAASNPPRFVSAAEIDTDGVVWAMFQDRSGAAALCPLCTTDELTSDFKFLLEYAKIPEEHWPKVFFELKAWIKRDHRVVTNLESNV